MHNTRKDFKCPAHEIVSETKNFTGLAQFCSGMFNLFKTMIWDEHKLFIMLASDTCVHCGLCFVHEFGEL